MPEAPTDARRHSGTARVPRRDVSGQADPMATYARLARRQNGRLALVAAILACIVSVVGAATLIGWNDWRRTLADARQEPASLAIALAGRTDQALQAVELAQTTLTERIRDAGVQSPESLRSWAGLTAVHHLVRDRVAGMLQAEPLHIVDASGRLIATSDAWPAPREHAAQRSLDAALRDRGPRMVARPARDDATGRWTLQVAQRIGGSGDAFLGAVIGIIGIDHVQDAHRSLSLEPAGGIAVLADDGTSRPYRSGSASGVAPQDGIPPAPLPSADSRPVLLLESRPLAAYPFRIQAAMSVEGALAVWCARMRWLIGGALAVAVHLHGARAAAAQVLAARSDALRAAAQHAEPHTAAAGMSQGLRKFAAERCLALTNGRCSEIVGYRQEAPPGRYHLRRDPCGGGSDGSRAR